MVVHILFFLLFCLVSVYDVVTLILTAANAGRVIFFILSLLFILSTHKYSPFVNMIVCIYIRYHMAVFFFFLLFFLLFFSSSHCYAINFSYGFSFDHSYFSNHLSYFYCSKELI